MEGVYTLGWLLHVSSPPSGRTRRFEDLVLWLGVHRITGASPVGLFRVSTSGFKREELKLTSFQRTIDELTYWLDRSFLTGTPLDQSIREYLPHTLPPPHLHQGSISPISVNDIAHQLFHQPQSTQHKRSVSNLKLKN